MTGDEFAIIFFRIWPNLPTTLSPAISKVLHSFFWDVENYCGDDELRGEGDIDEETFRERARTAFEKLLLLRPS